MTSTRIVPRTGGFRANGLGPRFAAFCALVAMVVTIGGCGRKSDVPVGDAAERIRKLTLAYVQYAATNRGVGPADQDALAKYIMQSNGVSKEEADAYFISPRDNQPYIVKWGQRPMGSGPIGHDPPPPVVLILESTGADGTRYVGNGLVSIQQMSAEELARAVPDQ